MMNTIVEILPSLQEIPHDRKGQQANNVTLLSRRFSDCQLEVSIAKSGRLRGWVTTTETIEVKLKGLPAYLTLERATELLAQSYLKLHKEAIEVLPKGLGGMKPKHTDPSAALTSEKVKTWEEKALQQSMPSISDIDSLVEAIADGMEKEVIRKAVKELLKDDPEKKKLDLVIGEIGAAGIQALGAALQVNHTLQKLYLGSNQIGVAGIQALGAALQVNHTLQKLNLFDNGIGITSAQAIATALKVNQTLQSLDLRCNQIGKVGAQILGAALQVNHTLQKLNIWSNEIGDTGARALGASLKVNHTLQKLNLGSNQIGAVGAQALAAALQVNHTLQALCLYRNQIGNGGAQALGASLKVNQTLQALDLFDNKIDDPGALAIGGALQVNQSIQSLNLCENKIGNPGTRAIGGALQVNHTLQTLHLQNNKIGDVGAQALGNALQVNHTLQALNIGHNLIHNAGVRALATALQVNHTLQKLYIWSNQIGETGAQALGNALQVNRSIQLLDLHHNQIGDAGAQALGAALQVNHTLQSLNLDWNKIHEAGAQALGAALQVNHTLQKLYLRDNHWGDNKISIAERVTIKRIDTLQHANGQMATAFQKQITKVQNFIQSHQNEEGIVLQHLPQLQELLQTWHTDAKDIIPSLEEILRQSGRTDLNDGYRKKLEGIITNLSQCLHDLWLEPFERKVAALSNEYVMGKELSEERNVDLGSALYETWLTFFGSSCPNWLENHIEWLIPFGVLLDIAEGGKKKDISELTDIHLLFERVLSFHI